MLSLYLVDTGTVLASGSRLRIEGDEAHHISRVARHRVDDRIWISNGEGQRATARIESIDRTLVDVVIEDVATSEKPRISLRVIQALTKSDRAHECIELLVAAGVDQIQPWRAERSIGKWDPANSPAKWREWIKAAVKQTRRDRIPILQPFIDNLSSSLPSQGEKEIIFLLHEEATESLDSGLQEQLQKRIDLATGITLIIGPEGGISERELMQLREVGVRELRLGTPILRSAHAGAIALTSLQASFGLWR
ncbi:MAG: RsmE family RNA methyltransferase [Actinomycetota bacterium]